jgi:SAM-dependent methyltransferase
LRPEECAYWDHVATDIKGAGDDPSDNIWKRCAIVSRILAHRPVRARVLEIGVGLGLGAAVVNLVTLGNLDYTGTDVSAKFCEFVGKRWRLNAVQTDILALPEGPFDMIWAFDTLEHIRKEDRKSGYAEMNRALAEHGVILINAPLDESAHEKEFDWGMNPREVFDIADAVGGIVTKWEPYSIEEVGRSYLWAEVTR